MAGNTFSHEEMEFFRKHGMNFRAYTAIAPTLVIKVRTVPSKVAVCASELVSKIKAEIIDAGRTVTATNLRVTIHSPKDIDFKKARDRAASLMAKIEKRSGIPCSRGLSVRLEKSQKETWAEVAFEAVEIF